ncbi:NADPH-dependent FMN reductase [Nocardioides jensenii]|uniref:NADPH-dependent FMN reductase n=1 Tax=Nocardioides jensenii TaxID=1843 RepID=UPI000829AEC6|nr:NADPH-dependent FMN reductase [Nocardioides jensenii]
MPDPVRILCLGGSTRPGSSSEQALRVSATAARRLGAEIEVIAGRDLILPIYDTETRERPALGTRLVKAVRRTDGVIIASPGYHGSMSGMIKNALDYLEDLRNDDRPYLDGIPVGLIAVAYGWQATASTLSGLRTTVHALRGWPTPLGAAVNASTPIFGVEGNCVDDSARFQLETVAEQVTSFAQQRAHTRSEMYLGVG